MKLKTTESAFRTKIYSVVHKKKYINCLNRDIYKFNCLARNCMQ